MQTRIYKKMQEWHVKNAKPSGSRANVAKEKEEEAGEEDDEAAQEPADRKPFGRGAGRRGSLVSVTRCCALHTAAPPLPWDAPSCTQTSMRPDAPPFVPTSPMEPPKTPSRPPPPPAYVGPAQAQVAFEAACERNGVAITYGPVDDEPVPDLIDADGITVKYGGNPPAMALAAPPAERAPQCARPGCHNRVQWNTEAGAYMTYCSPLCQTAPPSLDVATPEATLDKAARHARAGDDRGGHGARTESSRPRAGQPPSARRAVAPRARAAGAAAGVRRPRTCTRHHDDVRTGARHAHCNVAHAAAGGHRW